MKRSLRRFERCLPSGRALAISVRLLCVMLFNRYLKFFFEMGTGTAFGGARGRARERRRKEEAPLRREADGHAILPDCGFPRPQCPTGRTPSAIGIRDRGSTPDAGSHAAVDVGSVAAHGREFGNPGMIGSEVTHRVGSGGVAGERVGLAAAAAEIQLAPRAARERLLHPCPAAEGVEGRRVRPDIGERTLAHVPDLKAGTRLRGVAG